MKSSSIYLVGGWGYGNRGDNAILEAMLQSISQKIPSAKFVVTSYSIEETKVNHNVDAILSLHSLLTIRLRKPFSLAIFRWLAIVLWRLSGYKIMLSPALNQHVKLIADSDVVVMGGGGYFNDAWKDMLRVLYFIIEVASVKNTPAMIYGQTVGPFAENSVASQLRHYLSKLSGIAYRDVQSKKIVDLCEQASISALTADEANLLTKRESAQISADVPQLNVGVMIQKFRPHLGVQGETPQGRISDKQMYIQEVVDALLLIHERHQNIHFFVIPSTTWDEPMCQLIYSKLQERNIRNINLMPNLTADHFIAICQNIDVMISTNMHPVILAATANKPSIGLSYHYKLDDYMTSIGLEDYLLRIDNFSTIQLADKFDHLIEQLPLIKSSLSVKHNNIKLLAQGNSDMLVKILERRVTS